MKLRIFKNFFVTTACILFVTLTLLFIIMSFAMNSYVADSKRELLTDTVGSISSLIEENVPFNTILLNTQTFCKVNEIDIFVVNELGAVKICSCDTYEEKSVCIHSENPVSREFLSEISDGLEFKLSTIQGRFEDYRYTAAKRVIKPVDADCYYVFATSSTVTVTELTKMLFKIYAFSAIFPLLLMFIAEYVLTYRLTKPLKYMSKAARNIAKGDFSNRIPVMSDDEIGELSVLFNRMTDSLSRNEQVRRSFISNISHELKTPMTIISGFIDGIIDGTIDESRQKYYLKIVSEEVKRLSRLVQSMLSIARLESDERRINPVDFDFAELVLTVVVSMEQKITSKKLSIIGLEDLSHTVINADKDLIYQVVYNIVDNAVKYSNDGGKITFSSHRISEDIKFSVKNDGAGIASEDIPHIFERFYKADKSRSSNKDSLGLGLYITKTIVDLHDGEISVDSRVGEFTEFKLSLPINLILDKTNPK